MNFICNKTALSEAITNVSRAVSQKSTITALEGIKVSVSPNRVELTGYNLELGIQTSIAANTDDTGEFVVNARLFSEFARRMAGDTVNCQVDENGAIRLSCSSTECSFSAISASEFPDLPVVDAEKCFTIKQKTLKSMINMTSYAASVKDSKPILTGELFDISDNVFNLVAIDGFRLAIRSEETDYSDTLSFVVPKKALQEISSLIKDEDNDCTISTNEKHIIFKIDDIIVISRLLDGQFHNYKTSIPASYKTEILMNKKDLMTSLDRCSLIIDEKNKAPVRFETENGIVKVSCKTSIGKINDIINADISGDAITIGFNNRLLLDALRAAEGDKIRLRFSGATRVIEILPPEGESYIFLVMPIQLRN